MTMNRPFAGDWDAKVGADLNLASAQPDGYRPDKPLPIIGGNQDSGAAWASVGMPDVATVDARVDPTNDQSKLGTTFKHSIPIGERFSLTLQNSYSVTQTIGAPATTPSAVPLMAAPAGTAAAPTPQIWGNQKIVKFDILSTGTALRRRRHHGEQRSESAQHFQHRSNVIRPAARDGGGERSRPAERKPQHHRPLQAEAGSSATPRSRPRRAP